MIKQENKAFFIIKRVFLLIIVFILHTYSKSVIILETYFYI